MDAKQLGECRFYGIIDLGYIDVSKLIPLARTMITGGVDLIQLRGKNIGVQQLTALATELHAVTSRYGVPLIINDYAEIARVVALEGVHVGQADMTIAEVRALVDRPLLVGKSTHSLEQAVSAQREGADYIGYGPLFATPTKPDYAPIGLEMIKTVHQAVRIPVFCIGGIKLANLGSVLAAGGRRVVIVSELLQHDDIEAYGETVKKRLIDRSSSHPAGTTV
jgi:thiamine-phosphate pyrophosphorylase